VEREIETRFGNLHRLWRRFFFFLLHVPHFCHFNDFTLATHENIETDFVIQGCTEQIQKMISLSKDNS
jgi:hypothetical protein